VGAPRVEQGLEDDNAKVLFGLGAVSAL